MLSITRHIEEITFTLRVRGVLAAYCWAVPLKIVGFVVFLSFAASFLLPFYC